MKRYRPSLIKIQQTLHKTDKRRHFAVFLLQSARFYPTNRKYYATRIYYVRHTTRHIIMRDVCIISRILLFFSKKERFSPLESLSLPYSYYFCFSALLSHEIMRFRTLLTILPRHIAYLASNSGYFAKKTHYLYPFRHPTHKIRL